MINFLIMDRQEGKTTELVAWLRRGVQTDYYPGWSRILITHNENEASRIRRQYELEYHQVYSVWDWQHARLGRETVMIAIDNVDIFLNTLLGIRGDIQLIAATGKVIEGTNHG